MNIDELSDNWDLVVIGGGITGAGIFREAVRSGLKTLLVEKNFCLGYIQPFVKAYSRRSPIFKRRPFVINV